MPLFQIDEDEEVCQDFRLIGENLTDSTDNESQGERAPCVLCPLNLSLTCEETFESPENQIIEIGNPEVNSEDETQK